MSIPALRKTISRRTCFVLPPLLLLPAGLFAQQSYTWDQLRDKFKSTNPTLRAGEIGIDESKAQEVTAYLRPNPDFSASLDQINPFSDNVCGSGQVNCYRPLSETFPLVTSSYLL
jgi:outer membrane protein, heavy metal efflux system